jgi:hypothetical protein
MTMLVQTMKEFKFMAQLLLRWVMYGLPTKMEMKSWLIKLGFSKKERMVNLKSSYINLPCLIHQINNIFIKS